MRRIGRALAGLAALAAGAAGAEPAETVTVTGTAILGESIAPPPGTALRVDLHEAEARDAGGGVIDSPPAHLGLRRGGRPL